MAKKAPQESIDKWTLAKWTTKSGKPSLETGERYAPEAAIKAMTPAQYAATTRKKREDSKAGKQYSKQPPKIAAITAQYRSKALKSARKRKS